MTKEFKFAQMMELIYEFSDISTLYQSIPRTYGNEITLHMAEAHMIQTIGNHDGITITELSKLKNKSKSAMSQLVDKLYKKGLITKTKNPKDKKQISINLSEKGLEIYLYHQELDKNNYNKYLSRLNNFSEKDIEKTSELFKVLSEEFSNDLHRNVKK